MASSWRRSASPARDLTISSTGSGVCMMRNGWRDEQHPSLINFITSSLRENSFRLNFVPIAPDFIFNCRGMSIAFVFVTNWDYNIIHAIYDRVQKLKNQFAHLYIVVTLPTKEQNDSFVCSYFKYGMVPGRPIFVPVQTLEMGFEKIIKIALARGVCKQQDAVSKLKIERQRAVEGIDAFRQVLTSIPSIDDHDANALNQAIGSIEAISRATKDQILAKTDLSAEKAEIITRFFRDPKYYLSPKFI
ncbi:hypothetical protein Sjap_019127 [Stephania japonica]|uniref:Uncharacterized protein n=1 Tax=Stephania japonica TaxID=461633 RepID=A0AAP0F5E2_9MAGN